MKTLIRAIEVWVPDAEGQLLEFGDGLYGNAPQLRVASREMCFSRGEGLPGRAWDEARPILLKDLQASYFRRASAAKAAHLTCAVALPIYLADALKAVVVFFCGDAEDAGAIELWRNDPRLTPDMTLVDGYYGSTSQDFVEASGDTYLPRGTGLPGLAWSRQASVFMDRLTDISRFVRAREAAAAGIERGLAIPCPVPGRDNYALTFLSAASMPFALRVESWLPDPGNGMALRRAFGFRESLGKLPVGEGLMALGSSEAMMARAFASAVPQLWRHADAAPGADSAMLAASRLGGMLALPITGDGVVTEVVAIYF